MCDDVGRPVVQTSQIFESCRVQGTQRDPELVLELAYSRTFNAGHFAATHGVIAVYFVDFHSKKWVAAASIGPNTRESYFLCSTLLEEESATIVEKEHTEGSVELQSNLEGSN
jgi:hypothetical protein